MDFASSRPQEVPLTSLPECRLLNPLVFREGINDAQVILIRGDECYVLSRLLSFRCPERELIAKDFRDRCPFLRMLRFVSKQASLPTEFVAMTFSEVETLPTLEFPGPSSGRIIIIGQYRWQTAISPQIAQEADRLGPDSDIPICHEILLDALHAFERSDYRQAILYAAISVESLATTVLETEYSRVLASGNPPMHVNLLEFAQAGGSTTRKDPVYRLLVKGEHFSRLLHEAPLYLLRRSLLKDDEKLFQRSIRLYRTRNRLSHGKPVRGNDEVYSVDRDGTLESLDTAIRVFQWFGIAGYVLPVMDQVEISSLG